MAKQNACQLAAAMARGGGVVGGCGRGQSSACESLL